MAERDGERWADLSISYHPAFLLLAGDSVKMRPRTQRAQRKDRGLTTKHTNDAKAIGSADGCAKVTALVAGTGVGGGSVEMRPFGAGEIIFGFSDGGAGGMVLVVKLPGLFCR
jgi:hypothetical protein